MLAGAETVSYAVFDSWYASKHIIQAFWAKGYEAG